MTRDQWTRHTTESFDGIVRLLLGVEYHTRDVRDFHIRLAAERVRDLSPQTFRDKDIDACVKRLESSYTAGRALTAA
jgi:hypothetical protein